MKINMTLFEYECKVEELLDNAISDLSSKDCLKLFEYIISTLEDCEYDAWNRSDN